VRTTPEAFIEFLGDVRQDGQFGLLGRFRVKNTAAYEYEMISICKDADGNWCDYPRYEFQDSQGWKEIRIMSDGSIVSEHLSPGEAFDFWCNIEPFLTIDQMVSYRIIVDGVPSEPFQLDIHALRQKRN
jgi:hypothetical protein